VIRTRGRTLSARLIAIVAVLLTLACAVVGGVTYLALHRQLLSSLDQQVQDATGRWVECVGMAQGGNGKAPRPGTSAPKGPGPNACGQAPYTFEAVRSGSGYDADLAYQSKPKLTAAENSALAQLPTTTLAASPLQPGGTGPGGPSTGTLGSMRWCVAVPPTAVYTVTLLGARYRVTKVSCQGFVMVTGMSLTSTQHTIDVLLITEVIVFGVVLVLAVGSGIWLIRLSLRPLRRVAATATEVAELPLETGEIALPDGVPDTDPRSEVGQVGAAFNRMLGHVDRALGRRAASEARLRRFAADASHELRTPLSAIRGYAELALRHPGPVPEEVAHALGRVQSESARMSVLVDDLLLLARLDAGRPLESEPVDLSRLCIDATSDAHAARRDHRWRLDLPDDPVIVPGDEHRLHQVLANLLSNAGKHTPAGTTVTVTLTQPDRSSVLLSVADDGPGIPPELIPELFERFSRADTSRYHHGDTSGASTGLGLAIVDAVVTAHGGAIEVTSRPGATRFTITLPRDLRSARDRVAATATWSQALRPARPGS
jgi:two-component system, OmpR family, sensor kinase